ncbi:pyrroline-5-carboxylate reductase [Candidatus Symbiobacter mobilis]|uniref:Pyrroline-5-carboxylate reductase n=1 Tax=Candidatus Symbiobacter mobilis CR TaxID=946483 RepID=U5N6D8_9BURK|nr:pyrroline-5-carboxylate reductase [Candidatus Symbiobacter mobilis]AGX86830.1 pyrroline-5-carboxylate reductase [Candidatus Symbiobacter mobilis CR]
MNHRIAFVGGGNMARAILGGLLQRGIPAEVFDVVDPSDAARDCIKREFGIHAVASADKSLEFADTVVWAVKPQTFRQAALAAVPYVGGALHLSIAAGIRSDAISAWLGSQRIVRAMPNTVALIGAGVSGLYARAEVSAADRHQIESILSTTGDLFWCAQEEQLDAVTAISGCGPGYVFYFMEAMATAAAEMGLPADMAHRLTLATFAGAGTLARSSGESPETLRRQVTSEGGATHAAITLMEERGVCAHFIEAMHAAKARTVALGETYGTA